MSFWKRVLLVVSGSLALGVLMALRDETASHALRALLAAGAWGIWGLMLSLAVILGKTPVSS